MRFVNSHQQYSFLVVILFITCITGCQSPPIAFDREAHPEVKCIAILERDNINIGYQIGERNSSPQNGAIAGAIVGLMEGMNDSSFTSAVHNTTEFDPNAVFSNELKRALVAIGYEVKCIKTNATLYEKLDNKYQNFEIPDNVDVILDVRFDYFGYCYWMDMWSGGMLPRIDIVAVMSPTKKDDSEKLFCDYFVYGYTPKSSPKFIKVSDDYNIKGGLFTWDFENEAISKTDEFVEASKIGLKALAKKIAVNLM